MAQAQFSAGQRVLVARRSAVGGPRGYYAIIAALPRESGPQKYRVRGEGEAFERIIDEPLLEAVSYE